MQILKPGMMVVAIIIGLTDATSFAQMGGIGGMPSMGAGMGGMGSNQGRPKRKLHKSKVPVLNPALNMLPGAATSFEGQYLMRQLPQEQFLKSQQQTGKNLDKLQNEVSQNENQIRRGATSTGHRAQFMSYGNYYSFSGARGGGR